MIFSFIDYRNRMNQNARIQKQWVADQTAEKEQIQNCLKNEEA